MALLYFRVVETAAYTLLKCTARVTSPGPFSERGCSPRDTSVMRVAYLFFRSW